MKYRYRIRSVDEHERWLSVCSNDFSDSESPDSFIHLVQQIQSDVNGALKEVGELQYVIDGDGIGLLYQWDGAFGITILYPDGCKDKSLQFLTPYMSDF